MSGFKVLEEWGKTSGNGRCNLGDCRGTIRIGHDITKCRYVVQKVCGGFVHSRRGSFCSFEKFVSKLENLDLFSTTTGTGGLLVSGKFDLEVCNLPVKVLNFS